MDSPLIARTDSPPTGSSSTSLKVREEQAKEARREQLRHYKEWEKIHGNEVSVKPVRKTQKQRLTVMFEARHLLYDAVQSMNIVEMKDILNSSSTSPNLASEATGVSLLHLCCINNYLPGVQLLLEHGASVNIQDNDLWTPLHVAAACGHMEITKLLLAYDADCTLLDVDGNFACDSSRDPEIKALLLKHMGFKGIYESDMRFLRSRMAKAMLAAVKECIVRMMDFNILNANGVAPLHVAAANGYREAAMLLIDLGGADVNIKDDLGYTPLHIAVKYNQSKLVYLLLTRGADPTLLSSKLESPSDLTDDEEIIGLLEIAGEDQLKEPLVRPSFLPIVSPLTPSKVDTVSIDLEQFESPQRQSKLIDLETPISKLEALFEGQTLTDREIFDEGVDISTQRPALRRLRGSLFQKRTSGHLDLPAPSSTDNLATLSDLTEDIVLKFLKERYCEDQIYTNIGEILVAINPFKTLTIYNNQASEVYCTKIPDPTLSPHVFAVANQIYRNMLMEGKPQTCAISGESGAGKTETSKFLVQQLLFISDSVEKELNVKIEQVNPILEAFGNAKTVMNNNSSRFGKFLELSFTEDGHVLGASFKEYLLEKSRVVAHSRGERNFHIFYHLFAGLSAEEKAELELSDVDKHRCLNCGGDVVEDVVMSKMKEEFGEVRDSMEAIGFTRQEENNVLQTLAAILHITNITFDPKEEGVELSNSSLTSVIADLLLLDNRELRLSLVQEAMVTRGEVIVRQRTLVQASECRDAMAKALYGRMFGWIVNGINHHLQPEDLLANHSARIGVLDIFGFENFEKNSFEQMCINLANEQLQHFFNEHVFRWEEEECLKEGVATDGVTYESNWPIVNLFLAKNTGIFALVDEESRFPRATDHTLATKLHKGHGNCEVYHAPPDKGSKFKVSHYAGSVTYEVIGFLDKNRDTLPPSILQLLRTSGSMLVREIFEGKLTHTGSVTPSRRQRMSRKADSPYSRFNRKTSRRLTRISRRNAQRSPVRKPIEGKRAPLTVGNHFKNSLSELMDKLNASSPHFIRCIKPNSTKQPNSFDSTYVTRQLKYTGVMETTRIRQCGYPVRLSYEEFLKRYKVLTEFYTHELITTTPASNEQAVGMVLEKVGVSDWARGQSKVFLKFNHPVQLDTHSQRILLHIISIQRWFRELKKWKAAQEALRIRRQKVKLVQVSSSHTQDSSAMYRKRNGQGWNEGQNRPGVAQNAKNSNHNNSRGLKGYVLPTSPPVQSDSSREYVNLDDEDVYDSVVNTYIPETRETTGGVLQIKSLPLTGSGIHMSVPQVDEDECEEIYDDTESVLQAASQHHTGYYDYNDETVDEIYDDIASAQAQASVASQVRSSQTMQPPMIEEDIYDDTCVTDFRSSHSHSASGEDIQEIYSDASSVFDQPPPPRQPWVSTKQPPPLPPVSSIPYREQLVEEEEAVYSDATSVFHSPPPHMKHSQSAERLGTLQEDEEAVYNDASSVFDAPPVPTKPRPQRHSPNVPPSEPDYPSDTYTYLSDLDLEDTQSDRSAEQSPLHQPLLSGPAPPPIPPRAANLGRMGNSASVPSVPAVREEPPPLPAPRRSSEQVSLPPRSPKESGSGGNNMSPQLNRVITRQRSRAVKNRSISESSVPVPPRRVSSSQGPLGSAERLDGPHRGSPSHSPFGSTERLDQLKVGGGRVNNPGSESLTPPLHQRLQKRCSDPVAPSNIQHLPLPPIPAAVSVNHISDWPAHPPDGPSEEDYAVINDEELEFSPDNVTPQGYLTPIRQKPQHRKLQESKSTSELYVRKPTAVGGQGRPPVGSAPPPKPPRNKSLGTEPPPISARASRVLAGSSHREGLVPLPNLPQGPPPPPPTRTSSVLTSSPAPRRSVVLPDTPTGPPPPRPARKAYTPQASPPLSKPYGVTSSPPPPPPIGQAPPIPTSHKVPSTIPPRLPQAPPTTTPPKVSSSVPPPVAQAPPTATPPGVPPPPPPPPTGPIRQPSSLSTSSSSSSSNSGASPGSLLSGLQSIQLKKASERAPAKPPQQSGGPSQQSGGPSPGNLMAEMQSFKLRKTSRPVTGSGSSPGESESPALSPKPQMLKKVPPQVPGRRTSPVVNGGAESPTLDTASSHQNGVPEWKKSILDRKRKEQEEVQRAQQEAEERWAGVPQWKRKLLEERAATKAGAT